MTVPFLSVKPRSIKLKVSPRFPAQLIGRAGIDVTKDSGNYYLDLDYSDFPVVGSVPAGTNYVLIFDPATGKYVQVPTALIGGGAAPATAVPLVESGAGSVGLSLKYAREDHVHPAGGGGGGGASVLVSDTPPVGAADNSLWWESDTGGLFIRYNDGNSAQWVTAAGGGGSGTAGAVRYDITQTLTLNQRAQARANIDALKKNYINNGGMQVSQENGTAAGTANAYYPVDQFFANFGSTTAVVSLAQVASLTPGGSPNRIRATVTTADAAVGASDFYVITTKIEGLRCVDLKFGSTAAKTVTVQFGVKGPAGTYCVSPNNGLFNRSLVNEFTIAPGEANTDVVKSVTFTGDLTGTWATDSTAGIVLFFTLMGGTTFQTTAQTWVAGNWFSTANQFNFMGTNGNVFELFDVGLYEGAVAPSFQLPDFASELTLCQRYWEKTYDYATAPGAITLVGMFQYASINATSSGAIVDVRSYRVPKRAAPTITVFSPQNGASGKAWDVSNGANINPTIDAIGMNNFRAILAPLAAITNYNFQFHYTYNARM